MKVRILLTRSSGFIGKMIQVFTWSKWNHAAIEIDGQVFDSTFERGVGVSTMKQFKEHWHEIISLEVEMPNPNKAKEFLLNERGKSYDWTAIFGFVFRKNWAYRDRWFCSELVFCALSEGGVAIPANYLRKSNRITPRDIELITQFLLTDKKVEKQSDSIKTIK